MIRIWQKITSPYGSRALRGNPLKDALRPEPQERFSLHSHAERGNDEGEFREVNFDQILSLIRINPASAAVVVEEFSFYCINFDSNSA